VRRTDRLYALVEELRARAPRPVTRTRLAERFEVSSRTIERDVLALQEAGVPIWTQRGRAGGYAIEPTWSLPPLNFDATEALAVIAALAAARSMPFADAGRRAELKILASMQADAAATARELAGRLRLGSFGAAVQRQVLTAVETAVVGRRVVELEYRDREGGATTRQVEAHGLHLGSRGSYLLGWCRLRDAGRAFRLDRIESVRTTDEIAPQRDIDSLLDWVDAVAPEIAGEDVISLAARERRRARHGGPPRRVDDRSGAGPDFAGAVAVGLPAVAESSAGDRSSFRVGDAIFLDLGPGDRAFLRASPSDGALLSKRADVVATDDGVLVLLTMIGRDEVRELIERAWRLVAPKRAITAYERARAVERARTITFDDIRRLALALPEVTEDDESSGSHEFHVRGDRRTLFAKFGPPISNLLPPDDADTLMIRHCDQKPALLAAHPDRFFTTVHYGDPREPGAVLIRVSENRAEHLNELGELLEESWRHRVPSRLVQEWDAAIRQPPVRR